MDIDQEFIPACEKGNIHLVELMIHFIPIIYLNSGMYYACLGGHINVIKFLIDKGADNFQGGMNHACLEGHKEIVEFMISKGANDWNTGLDFASCGGHIDMVKFMISKGATTFNEGLYQACCGYIKNKEIILFLIEKGANIDICDMELDFEDIYYLLLKGIKNFGKFSDIADKCKEIKREFGNVSNELFIKDVANIVTEY